MMLKIKIGLIATIYVFSGLFMVIFPPKNFKTSNEQRKYLYISKSDSQKRKYTTYMSSEIIDKFGTSTAKLQPDFVNYTRLAPATSTGRYVGVLVIKSDLKLKKKGILVVGALDPMVWGAPNAILELAHILMHGTKKQMPFLIEYDWYLIPLGNPEGMDYTQAVRDLPISSSAKWSRSVKNMTARAGWWHKNLACHDSSSENFGINVDRNFAFHWQDEDTHHKENPFSQWYPGSEPFSTAESQAIRNYLNTLEDETVHLAIHLSATFTEDKESIVYPWHYAERKPSNYGKLQKIGESAARNARLPGGRLYEVHQSSADGPTGGTFPDYMMGVVGTDLVYTVKPYHQPIPNSTHAKPVDVYVTDALGAIFGLVQGWRATSKQNTLLFFGHEKQF